MCVSLSLSQRTASKGRDYTPASRFTSSRNQCLKLFLVSEHTPVPLTTQQMPVSHCVAGSLFFLALVLAKWGKLMFVLLTMAQEFIILLIIKYRDAPKFWPLKIISWKWHFQFLAEREKWLKICAENIFWLCCIELNKNNILIFNINILSVQFNCFTFNKSVVILLGCIKLS